MEVPGSVSGRSGSMGSQSLRDFIQSADAETFVYESNVDSMSDYLDVHLHEGHSVEVEHSSGNCNGSGDVTPKNEVIIVPKKEAIAEECYDQKDDNLQLNSIAENSFSISCGLCSFKGTDTLSIINHMKYHRFRTTACCICGIVLGSSDELGRHLATHKKEVPHTCSYCHHGFFRLSSLQSHNCPKKPSLVCQYCGELFRFKNSLKKHIRSNHKAEVPKKLYCPHCDFSCWSTEYLSPHLKTHANNKYLQCPHCTFQFSQVATLQSHLRIHKNEQSFTCPYCGSVFAKYGVVKVHMEIHKDRYTLKCQKCDFQTPSQLNLSVHVFRNHRAKVFSCRHCEYKTAVPLRYKMHLLSHKGDAAKLHACASCEYRTKYMWDLKRHAQSRHKEQEPSYACPHCDFVASTLSALKQHAPKHVKKLPPPDFLEIT